VQFHRVAVAGHCLLELVDGRVDGYLSFALLLLLFFFLLIFDGWLALSFLPGRIDLFLGADVTVQLVHHLLAFLLDLERLARDSQRLANCFVQLVFLHLSDPLLLSGIIGRSRLFFVFLFVFLLFVDLFVFIVVFLLFLLGLRDYFTVVLTHHGRLLNGGTTTGLDPANCRLFRKGGLRSDGRVF
jgi:hypothetical protein